MATRKRDAPAYQEYSANLMARIDYRAMSLAERGLLYTLRNECWVNRQVPADVHKLARILGYDPAEVQATLPAVMPFFAMQGAHLVCPELDDYREKLDLRREQQSQGGKQGAARTNSKHRIGAAGDGAGEVPPTPPGTSAGKPSGDTRVARESLVQLRTVKTNTTQVLTEEPIDQEWVNAYDNGSNGF
jgi:uncharacterized protein YdaU (DUF1376 family)